MLKTPRSLARQAGLVFAGAYAAIALAILGVSAASSWADRGPGNQRGPYLARSYAADELTFAGSTPRLPRGGRYADLERRNAGMWSVVIIADRMYTRGPVDSEIGKAVSDVAAALQPTLFRIPGRDGPYGFGAVEAVDYEGRRVIIAAGGVDARTLTLRESLHILLEPRVLLLLALIAAMSVVGAALSARVFARSLRDISAQALALHPGQPVHRLDHALAPAELSQLVRSFNIALDRLDAELRRQRRFISDAAHELRTPLAVLRLQVDGLEAGADQQRLRTGLSRMERLIEQMLDLERLTLGTRKHDRVDLAAIVREAVADIAPLAIDRGYDLRMQSPAEPVWVLADTVGISRVITNLVANAIVHGGGGGSIDVEVGVDGTATIRDNGSGVDPRIITRLFEPFVRGHAREDGSGLGLHLSQQIMNAQHGTLEFLPTEDITTFKLSLPRH